MRSRWFLVPFVVLGLGCRDKAEPGIEGQPFVAATLDGTLWTADETRGAVTAVLTPEKVLSVSASTGRAPGSDTARTIGFQVNQFHGVGTYPLATMAGPTARPDAGMAYYEVLANMPLVLVAQFHTSSVQTGEVRVTAVDSTTGVIAGTFAFTAEDLAGTRLARITSGSFRVRHK